MILDNKINKPVFWLDENLKEFESVNKDKTISTLTWHHKDEIIIQQLNFAMEQNSDVLISELLPHELPDKILLNEYNFFSSRYHYKSPDILREIEVSNESQTLIISDSNELIQNNTIYSIILNSFKDQNNTKSIDLKNDEHRLNLSKLCSKSSRFLINSQNIVLINLILSHCNKYDKSFTILNNENFDYLRYMLQGCLLSDSANFEKQTSLRSKISRSLKFSKISDYFVKYQENEDILIKNRYVEKIFQYSNNYGNNDIREKRLSRYSTSACFNLISTATDCINSNANNFKFLCEYLFQYVDQTNFNYRRIKFFRDLVIKNPKKLGPIFNNLYHYPFNNNQYTKFPILHEFLISTLIASNESLLDHEDQRTLFKFGTNGFKNDYLKERFCNDYNLYCYLDEPLDNFDGFKEKITQNIDKPNSDFKSICQLLLLYPTFIEDDLIISLFEIKNINKNKAFLTNLLHGVLYSFNLDIFDIYFKCFSDDNNTKYDSLNSILNNPKVFPLIPPYLSNVLACFLKNQNLGCNRSRLTPTEKFSISRIYHYKKDFKSVIDLLSTIEIKEPDSPFISNFLHFNEIWSKLGINEQSINLSTNKFTNPNLSHSELANFSHYIKSKNIFEHFSLCRENESTNPYSFHHFLD